ncbi:MAG: hypothetical protein KDA24_29490 [Deltaproteobacteria bacterium]|nr:hypothetical protein [Deltaproteobacteria bacterium]
MRSTYPLKHRCIASIVAMAAPVSVVAAGLLVCDEALAHDVRFARMVHVRFLAEGAEVAMVVQLHAGPDALKVRQRFDADGDDRITGDEVTAMRDWFGSEAFRDFSLHVGAAGGAAADPVAMDLFEIGLDLGGDDGVARGGELLFRVVQRGTFVLRPGSRALVVRDAPANRREEIALRFDLPPPLPLKSKTTQGAATDFIPMGNGSYQVLLARTPGTMTLEVSAPRDWRAPSP